MSDREREKHIEQLEALLEGMQRCEEVMSTPNRIKAIEYAISSIKTDLKYDLMYENDEDMVFLTKEAYADLCARASGIITEPTTKNDLGVDWDELKRKILMEVDGGTDDKYLRYADVCDRISDSIDEYIADMREVIEE